ncbi:MAG: bifunctional phosphopantothenoylcysteine decarboxylase/phosphopantothenate--cysteine ligase CoaBC [Bacteroidota bacterium]|jgi:phosphopantothenoylcysteine decarboxylase/phosphopantothenate--cysteine ligase
MLKNRHIVLGITGGVAAYKLPLLAREFKKAGAQVRVVMTDSAKAFVTPITFSTLSGNEVVVGMFPDQEAGTVHIGTWHIDLAQWAELMFIAPATANTIAKLAHGYADNAVTALALALRCPLVIAPAMDSDMWVHSATQENITKLREMGYTVLPPAEGELASGLVGPGRLPELDVLVRTAENILGRAHFDLHGKKILVTAGPTHEAIDPVRFVGNRSSGKMGFAIANAATQRGAEVTLISGPVSLATPRNVLRVDVESAREMHNAVMKHFPKVDAVVMAAAVADFSPAVPSSQKIKKEKLKSDSFSLELKRTKDILQALGEKKNGVVLVGFALETESGVARAKTKLKQKNLDLVVLNKPLQEGAGIGADTNIVTLISKNGKVEKLPKMTKFDAANEILDRVKKILW